MDKRILAAMAVVAAALAALLVFALMPSTPVITASSPMPTVVADATADGAPAAGVDGGPTAPTAPPPEPGHRAKLPTTEAESKVDVPAGAKVEDGGVAFGDAVCQHVTSCGCQKRTPRACAQAYAFVTPETYGKAKCLVDLPCAELCESLENPGKTTSACARGVNDLVADRFRNRGK